MAKKILVMGLPGAGKSYLSRILAPMIEGVWLNADEVRKEADDWDFTMQGRLRQAERMNKKADDAISQGKNVIADFICPTEKTREHFEPDYTVFMNTIDSGRYKDTNKIFESPGKVDFEVKEQRGELYALQIADDLFGYTWDNKKPTAQMLGRWQPWHEGHQKIFEEAIQKTGQVNIMVRDVHGLGDNPFAFEEVKKRIESALTSYRHRVQVTLVPNITDIFYGRDVGYNIEEINLPENVKKVSATTIRSEMRKSGQLR